MEPTVIVEVKRFPSTSEIVIVRRPLRRLDTSASPPIGGAQQ